MRCSCLNILSFLLCAVFVGCRDKTTDNMTNEFCKILESNTNIIRNDINIILNKLNNEKETSEFKDRAIPVYKKVEQCNRYSQDIIKEIDFLKSIESQYLSTLKVMLKSYINKIKDIDTSFYNQHFITTIGEDKFKKMIDSLAVVDVPKENINFYFEYLKNVVNHFELNYVIEQNRQVALGCNLIYDFTIPLIGVNRTHLKANEQLIIEAGIGMYAKNTKTKVYIDGKLVPERYNGYVEYKTFVTGKKGKYSKQVVVEYVQPCDTANVKRYECDVKYTID